MTTLGLLLISSALAVAVESRNAGDPIWFTLKIWSTDLDTKVTPTQHILTHDRGTTTGFEAYQGGSPEPVFQIPADQTEKQYIVGQLNFYQIPSEGREVYMTAVPDLDPAQEVACSVTFTEDPGLEDVDWFLRQAAPDKLTIECNADGIVGQ